MLLKLLVCVFASLFAGYFIPFAFHFQHFRDKGICLLHRANYLNDVLLSLYGIEILDARCG